MLGQSYNFLMDAFIETFVKFAKERISTYGTRKLLDVPEYDNDKKKLQKVMDLLDDPTKLKEIVSSMSSVDDNVMLSSDEEDIAIVKRDFGNNAKIAIVGPQRMDYKKILSTLEYIAEELDKFFGDSLERNKDDEI